MASILMLNKAAPDYPGGAETRLREVGRRWAKAGHAVHVLCAKTEAGEPAWSDDEGVEVRRIKVMPDFLLRRFPRPHYLPQALFYVVAPPHVLYYLRRWRIEAIRDSMSPFPALGLLAPWLGRRGIVVLHILFGDYHGWREFYPAPYAAAGAIAERLLASGRLGYRALVTDAPWLAEALSKRVPPGTTLEAVENGVALDVPRRQRRGRILRLVNAARLVEHKGQEELLAGCARLQARGVEFELTLFGGGPLRSRLDAAIAREGLRERVRILPALGHAALLEALPGFDLYVMPSRSEGLPVVLLEAMAAQLPVVVADRPYASTLLEPSVARFYDPASAESLADAVTWAIGSPAEAEDQAERARAFVERFTWDRTATAEWRLLSRVLEAK